MKIGTTFSFEGNDYSIKSIDMSDPDKKRFPNGRLNASKFKGVGSFATLQAGRPKAFDIKVVADILGVAISSESYVEDVENATIPDDVSQSWESFRRTPIEKVDKVLDMLDDKATVKDW